MPDFTGRTLTEIFEITVYPDEPLLKLLGRFGSALGDERNALSPSKIDDFLQEGKRYRVTYIVTEESDAK